MGWFWWVSAFEQLLSPIYDTELLGNRFRHAKCSPYTPFMFAPHPHCHQFPTQSITCQPFYSHDLTAFTSVLSHIVKQAWAGSALKNRDWEFRWIDWKRPNDGSSIIAAGKWGELWDSNWNSDKAVFEAVCLSSDWTGERCLGAAIAKATAVPRNGVSEDSSHGCSSQVQRIQTDIRGLY